MIETIIFIVLGFSALIVLLILLQSDNNETMSPRKHLKWHRDKMEKIEFKKIAETHLKHKHDIRDKKYKL